MLPTELLRVRVSGKMNQIRPIFYDYEKNNELSLPSKIIKIFEETSRIGYPVTENERKRILQKVALKNNLTIDELELAMWNDLDKNKHLKNFDSLSPLQLVVWYNISILQTLLLNCVKLEFSVYGGFNWKKILRKIKQLGLMYFLHQESNLDSESNNQTKNEDMVLNGKKDKRVVCTVDGP